MMAEFDGIHPGEGTIHAWLDDALDASEAARVEAHVDECASCSERVAEARGLIAGASRVVGLLDESPRPLVRPASSPTNGTDFSARRAFRVTPMRASIAAMLLVAAGLTLTRDRIAVESSASRADSGAVAMSQAADLVAGSPPEMSPQAPMAEDSVLASAVAKRVAQDQPRRGVGAAPGITMPRATPAPSANAPTLNTEPAREIAAGRAMARLEEVVSSGATADKAATKASVPSVPGAGCYRIASSDTGAATWGGIVLPANVALSSASAPPDAEGPRYAITPFGGGAAIGSWARAHGDGLTLTLRGATAITVGALTPERAGLAGTLTARDVSVAAGGAAAPQNAAGSAEGRLVRSRFDSAPTRRAGGRSVRVSATRIDCPQ